MSAATLLALGRVAAGGALLAAPTATGAPWIGGDARRGGTRVFARALGVRDLALGLGALAVRGTPRERPVLLASAACDLVDGWATWRERGALPAPARLVVGVAGAAALAEAALAARRGPAAAGT